MAKVTIYTDGACEPNPGPGGWAAVLRYGAHVREISGSEASTTSNRMELTAAIKALSELKRPIEVDLYTDSQYLQKGLTQWLDRWKAKGSLTSGTVKNADLWRQLDRLATVHDIECHWVRGHSGVADNERCDELAYAEIGKLNAASGRPVPPTAHERYGRTHNPPIQGSATRNGPTRRQKLTDFSGPGSTSSGEDSYDDLDMPPDIVVQITFGGVDGGLDG